MKIAITGGIGSGKSSVINILAELGQPTVNLDMVYKELLNNDEDFVLGICKVTKVPPKLKTDGKPTVDLKAVSKKVFSNGDTLKSLNSFTHPRIYSEAFLKGKPFELDGKPVFYEVPLLFESGYQNAFDKIWIVSRKITERIKYTAKRDNANEKEIEDRIKNQFDYENADLSLHTIISNDGNIAELRKKVVEALNEVYKVI